MAMSHDALKLLMSRCGNISLVLRDQSMSLGTLPDFESRWTMLCLSLGVCETDMFVLFLVIEIEVTAVEVVTKLEVILVCGFVFLLMDGVGKLLLVFN